MELEAVIVAGGRGTRTENPNVPKCLLTIDGQPLLGRQINWLKKSGISIIHILIGFGGDQVRDFIRSNNKIYNVDIRIIEDKDPNPGPVGALRAFFCQQTGSNNNYLVLLGDTFVEGDLASTVDRLQPNFDLHLFAHKNLHPRESDTVFLDEESNFVSFNWKGSEGLDNYRPLALTGVYFVGKHLADKCCEMDTTISDIARALVDCTQSSNLRFEVRKSTFLSQDIGTPERLDLARKKARRLRESRVELKRAIFIDRDGTLIPNAGESRKTVESGIITEAMGKSLARANELGIWVFMVTNQPGIAKGFIEVADFFRCQREIDEQLARFDAKIDDVKFCPHHPESGFENEIAHLKIECSCRKPQPAMLTGLLDEYCLDPSVCIFFGDSDADEGAGELSGIQFRRVTNVDDLPSLIDYYLSSNPED